MIHEIVMFGITDFADSKKDKDDHVAFLIESALIRITPGLSNEVLGHATNIEREYEIYDFPIPTDELNTRLSATELSIEKDKKLVFIKNNLSRFDEWVEDHIKEAKEEGYVDDQENEDIKSTDPEISNRAKRKHLARFVAGPNPSKFNNADYVLSVEKSTKIIRGVYTIDKNCPLKIRQSAIKCNKKWCICKLNYANDEVWDTYCNKKLPEKINGKKTNSQCSFLYSW